jgi:hypothetical protein
MIFGLSTSHAAATLAIILVGYNIIIGETPTGEPIRLLTEDVLNGTILLILVSCAVSSFAVQRAARQIAVENETEVNHPGSAEQRMLIALAYPDTVTELVDLGMMLKPHNSSVPVYALHIISDEPVDEQSESTGKKMLEKAVHRAAGTGNLVEPITRYDTNISNGIIYTIKEKQVTDVIIGLHHLSEEKDFLGNTTARIVKRTYENIFIYKPVQPVNTLRRLVVAVPPKAEFEPGFAHWYMKLHTLAREAGLSIVFYAKESTITELRDQQRLLKSNVSISYSAFSNWDDFLVLSGELKQNDLFTIITSRKGHISYSPALDKLSYYLSNYFLSNGFLLIYPKQLEQGLKMDNIQHSDASLAESISEQVLTQPGNWLKDLFRKKKTD